MTDDKVASIIEKFAKDTKNNTYRWNRLYDFDNSTSYNHLAKNHFDKIKNEYHDTSLRLNYSESFFIKYKDGLIILLKLYDDFLQKNIYNLAVQSNSNAKISILNKNEDYQSDLMRLEYLIEEQLSSVNDFIDDILNS